MTEDMTLTNSSENELTTRGKVNRKEPKNTVGITIPLSLLTEAKKQNLHISRIVEEAF